MKKIFITGITGLLGGNTAYNLKEKYDIYGVDRNKLIMPGVNYYNYDLTDYNKLEENINEVNPEFIIHCAAAVNVDKCEEEPDYAFELNTKLTEKIADISRKKNIRMIYISTDAVYNGEKEGLYNEDDETDPVSVYGKSKLEGEKFVLESENNTVIRTNIYGFNIQNKYSFGEWILNSLMNNEKLNMFYDVFYSPILVNDLTFFIDSILDKNICGLYNVCSTGSVSKYEFGIMMKKIFNIKSGVIEKTSVENFNFKARRTKNMGMDNSKIKDILRSEIRTPKESIEKFKELYDENYSGIIKKYIEQR